MFVNSNVSVLKIRYENLANLHAFWTKSKTQLLFLIFVLSFSIPFLSLEAPSLARSVFFTLTLYLSSPQHPSNSLTHSCTLLWRLPLPLSVTPSCSLIFYARPPPAPLSFSLVLLSGSDCLLSPPLLPTLSLSHLFFQFIAISSFPNLVSLFLSGNGLY